MTYKNQVFDIGYKEFYNVGVEKVWSAFVLHLYFYDPYSSRESKGAKYKLRGQIEQNVRLCRAPVYGFSKYSDRHTDIGRNRPLLAVRARYGLSVTSMSRNC